MTPQPGPVLANGVGGSDTTGVYVMWPTMDGAFTGTAAWSVTWSGGSANIGPSPSRVTWQGREYYRAQVSVADGNTYRAFSVRVVDDVGNATSAASPAIVPARGWTLVPTSPNLSSSSSIPYVVSDVVTSSDATGRNPQLSWNAVPEADHYDVHRAVAPGSGLPLNATVGSLPWTVYKNGVSGTTLLAAYAGDSTQTTYFRVFPASDVFGRAAVTGNPSHIKNIEPFNNQTTIGDAPPPGSTGDGTASGDNGPKADDSGVIFETNLPMIRYGVGVSADGSLHDTTAGLPGYTSKLWRKGMIVMSANRTAARAAAGGAGGPGDPNQAGSNSDFRRYGFLFQYNPAGWSQTAAMFNDVDFQTLVQTADPGANLPLPSSFAKVGLTLYLNRTLEVALGSRLAAEGPDALSRYFETEVLSADGADLSLTSGGRGVSGRGGMSSIMSNFPQKLGALIQKGTMADLEYLYRTIVGTTFESDQAHDEDPYKVTADIGALPMALVDIHLGERLRYSGRITSLSIQHLMFNHRMVPTMSEVSIELTRGLVLKVGELDKFDLYDWKKDPAVIAAGGAAPGTTVAGAVAPGSDPRVASGNQGGITP